MELTTPQGLSTGGPTTGGIKSLPLLILIASVIGLALGAAGYFLILNPTVNKNTANSNTAVVGSNTNTSSSESATNQNTAMVPSTCQESQFTAEERELFDSSLYPDGPPGLGEKCLTIQQLRLSSVMLALEVYKDGIATIADAEGHYPTSLDELTTNLKQKETACKANEQEPPSLGLANPSCENISNRIPQSGYVDVYTGLAFPYAKVANDYELTYVIRLYDGIDPADAQSIRDGLNTIKGSENSLLQ